jgi:hypothetical protein
VPLVYARCNLSNTAKPPHTFSSSSGIITTTHLFIITPHPHSHSGLYNICISPPPNPVLRIPLITTPCATAPSENIPFACWKGRSYRVARLQKHADTRIVGLECEWETEVSAYTAMRLRLHFLILLLRVRHNCIYTYEMVSREGGAESKDDYSRDEDLASLSTGQCSLYGQTGQ